MTPASAAAAIEKSRKQDQYAFAEAVGAVLDHADRIRWLPWRRGRALALYRVVADLDPDDEAVEVAVEDARQYLEAKGVPCEPSYSRLYQDGLTSKSPFQQHLSAAKLAMEEAASGGSARRRKKSLRHALEHYGLAAKHGELSQQQQRIVAGLRKRLGA